MYHKYIYLYLSFVYLSVSADTYIVKVGTEQHVNLVDSKFLSFTIDPKYLFSSSEKYNTKECICMASSLTPAYVRIAGPSTSHMTFRNTTIAIDDVNQPKKPSLSRLFTDEDNESNSKKVLTVTHEQWEKFVHWAKTTGFDLVFALNSDEKTSSGMWDANTALKILTVADQANIGEIFWQFGYECANQSIEEYLNDLETLRVIIETFPPGKGGDWLVVGGDVTHCLQADSKSDFKDYVTLSNDMMDAILLNGNSSSQELERMSEKDRYKLLKLLSNSDIPLWLTEHTHMVTELDRAADWMTSLGYSARNGFSVHYRELLERELYEPTLSFYMALLFKNLVGERVLSVDIDSSQSIMFAHCTSLRHKPVSGAITLYGVNMDEEPARFSIKLSKKEDGGDIMQFILGHDHSGNIVVNNRAMYHEGDIRPVVKRVRPYRTLLLNLPPKSFGFWVLANTKVEACNDNVNNKLDVLLKNKDKDYTNYIKTKRSIEDNRNRWNLKVVNNTKVLINEAESYDVVSVSKAIKERIDKINNDLRIIKRKFKNNSNRGTRTRIRRDIHEDKPKSHSIVFQNIDEIRSNIFNKLSKISKKHISKIKKSKRPRSFKRDSRKKSKRNFKSKDSDVNDLKDNEFFTHIHLNESINNLKRKCRSVAKSRAVNEHEEDQSVENEISNDTRETFKVAKFLHKLRKLSELPLEIHENDSDSKEIGSEEGIVLKTKVSDDSATIDITEKSHSGLLKSTLQDIWTLLSDFNKHINRFWTAVTFLE